MSKIRYFHFHGVSHRHLIFKNIFSERLPLILFLLVTNHTLCGGFEKISEHCIEWYFKKSSEIRHLHFHGVSHRHLIFKNSSQKGFHWYYFYLWQSYMMWRLWKNFWTLYRVTLFKKSSKNKAFLLSWSFTQTCIF